MTAEGIALWWIGERAADDAVLEAARAEVERVLVTPTTRWSRPERPTGTYDAVRGQHSSTAILKWLAADRARASAAAPVVIAVTDADLFIPVLTFVFGEAKLGGGVAVVSTARLAGPPAQPVDVARLVGRLAKESIHELGHAFGLLHCAEARCVMARSASLVHVDAKNVALCHDCRIRFRERLLETEGEPHGR